jgi:hypothetical protein
MKPSQTKTKGLTSSSTNYLGTFLIIINNYVTLDTLHGDEIVIPLFIFNGIQLCSSWWLFFEKPTLGSVE